MRRVCFIAALAIGAAAWPSCGRKPPAVVVAPAPTPAQRLASADALVRAGCLECLLAAYGEYDLLRGFPAARDSATAGAVRSAGLIALRERELGLVDEGYSQRARALLIGAPNLPGWLSTLLDIIEVLPVSVGGITRTPTSDLDLERGRVLRANRDAWSARLRELAPVDELAAYVWLAFTCGAGETRNLSMDELVEPAATFRDTPLIGFKRAICRGIEPEPLEALRREDARFGEVPYYLGLYASGQRKLDEAERRYEEAYAWRTQWPTLTQALANIAMTAEEFDRALTLYNRTLEFEPQAVDALLGKARALTYLGRNVEAIATTDQLIAQRWFVGDARYWRALNESELDRNDDAWTDIEAAAKLIINAQVPKLAGLIAYRRQQLDVSRAKFEESRARNPLDCETVFYLGVVLAEQRSWGPTAEVLLEAARCLEANDKAYLEEIASIQASAESPARKAGKIARREQYIAKGRRQLATSWFDVAVAYFNLSRKTEARQFAEKVVEDEQFGARAREILDRLK
jgi:tetratricopeptide (TPR) repeat protein